MHLIATAPVQLLFMKQTSTETSSSARSPSCLQDLQTALGPVVDTVQVDRSCHPDLAHPAHKNINSIFVLGAVPLSSTVS